MVTREVLIPTVRSAGKGDKFVFPVELDYKNTIHAILFFYTNISACIFKFETKDGAVSVHPNSTYKPVKTEICPKEAPITMIQVWHSDL